jgi:5-methylthioadenosine/S-adenosylhomocysteine deaminase
MDAAWWVLPDGAVAVRDGEIVAVGPRAELAERFAGAAVRDCSGCAVLPGLVNGHTHLAMSPFRGLAADKALQEWLFDYIFPAEQHFVDAAFVRAGSRLAAAELIRGGTTTFVDMYFFAEEVAQVAAEVGLRAVCGQAVMDLPTPDAATAAEGLARAERFIAQWQGHPLVMPAVAPHAPYTCSVPTYAAAAELAQRFGVPLVTHLSETAREVAESQARHSLSPIAWAADAGAFAGHCIAAHCVHVSDDDIAELVQHGVGVVPCPTSNLKLASGVAPYARLLDAGVHLGLGTDGPASNDDLDMWSELHLAALLPKGLSGDPTVLPARAALALATRSGAAAAHLADRIGQLTPGRRADIVIVDLGGLHTSPRYRQDPDAIYTTLVYGSRASDVRDVLVDGRWLLQDGQLLTVDGVAAQAVAQHYADAVDAWSNTTLRPV